MTSAFVKLSNKVTMKKFTLFILSLFASTFVFADNPTTPPTLPQIPIGPSDPTPVPKPLTLDADIDASYYDGVLTLIFNVDLGDADITVTNLSTGDIWWDSVSGVGTTAIMLSGDEGYYEVHISTDRGEYSGAFTL